MATVSSDESSDSPEIDAQVSRGPLSQLFNEHSSAENKSWYSLSSGRRQIFAWTTQMQFFTLPAQLLPPPGMAESWPLLNWSKHETIMVRRENSWALKVLPLVSKLSPYTRVKIRQKLFSSWSTSLTTLIIQLRLVQTLPRLRRVECNSSVVWFHWCELPCGLCTGGKTLWGFSIWYNCYIYIQESGQGRDALCEISSGWIDIEPHY